MFAKFRYTLTNNEDYISQHYTNIGEEIFEDQRNQIKETLDSYLLPDGSLDAEEIELDWFPSIEAQIFLSHSHADENQVKAFAGWLYEEYKIKSFIDSTVWGYADNLLQMIDDKYCRKENNKNSYEYSLLKRSSAHIHMLLQGALAKMINSCECLIFVNSPNSIKPGDIKNVKLTGSPWIYSELLLANTFPARSLKEYRIKAINESTSFSRLEISYRVNIEKMIEIEENDFVKAARNAGFDLFVGKMAKGIIILDQLYVDKGLIEKSNRTLYG